ncbi:MAG: glycosyl transferase family protein [Pseudomonadota bacterium]
MVAFVFPFLEILQRELLLFASLCFLIGALDDVAFDGLWIAHVLKRRFLIHSRYPRTTVEALGPTRSSDPPGALAIFVPAWKEAAVIGTMIRRCREQWQYPAYRIYVGCYPNDPETVTVAARAARGSDKIRLVICSWDGPTSKADCLNRLWQAMCADEIAESMRYKAVILQDAEDLVHPGALDLFNHLSDRASLVQLPVIPRRAVHSRWVAGHYGDEFAELHGKQMVLREALGVSLPSAGVGSALSRDALGKLASRTQSKPFDAASLTEDYELGIHLTAGEARGIFARLTDRQGELVATQEFFPDNLEDAVRQKSRWITGIALSGWDRMGWKDCWRENWMRWRDRRACLAALVIAVAYVTVVLTGLLELARLAGLHSPRPLSEPLVILLLCNAVFLVWRLAIKSWFVFRLYGLAEALYALPRTVVANWVNILAARRAIIQYVKSLRGTPLQWEKTNHSLPEGQKIRDLRRKISVSEVGEFRDG